MAPMRPLLLASWPREEDLGGTFLAVAEAICFRDPPRVPPARHWLSTYAFRQWNGKMDLDKLMNSETNLSASQDFLEPQGRKRNRQRRPRPVIQQQQDAPSSVARAPAKAGCPRGAIPCCLGLQKTILAGLRASCVQLFLQVLFKAPQGPEVLLQCLSGHCEDVAYRREEEVTARSEERHGRLRTLAADCFTGINHRSHVVCEGCAAEALRSTGGDMASI
uniref:Uncharacterized protein n=1 Tax=Rangifer tarandus platyrhynchus TaxID=3082113 RepID=A0ACB0E3I1_RANTA|nr:unnamed protein product [Rangifer tarandus platyrhynchus]